MYIIDIAYKKALSY